MNNNEASEHEEQDFPPLVFQTRKMNFRTGSTSYQRARKKYFPVANHRSMYTCCVCAGDPIFFRPLLSTALNAHIINAIPAGFCARTHPNEPSSCLFSRKSFGVGPASGGNARFQRHDWAMVFAKIRKRPTQTGV